jgi:hypothetical protein
MLIRIRIGMRSVDIFTSGFENDKDIPMYIYILAKDLERRMGGQGRV